MNSLLLSPRFSLERELLLELFISNDFLEEDSAISLSLRLLSRFATRELTRSSYTFICCVYSINLELCLALSSFRQVVKLSRLGFPWKILSFLLQKSSFRTALSFEIELLMVVSALYIDLSYCFDKFVLVSEAWLLNCSFLY